MSIHTDCDKKKKKKRPYNLFQMVLLCVYNGWFGKECDNGRACKLIKYSHFCAVICWCTASSKVSLLFSLIFNLKIVFQSYTKLAILNSMRLSFRLTVFLFIDSKIGSNVCTRIKTWINLLFWNSTGQDERKREAKSTFRLLGISEALAEKSVLSFG